MSSKKQMNSTPMIAKLNGSILELLGSAVYIRKDK